MSSETEEKVLSIIKNIKNTTTIVTNVTSGIDNHVPEIVTETKSNAMRGKPKSGKFWKSQKERFSSIVKTKGIRPDFRKKTALRCELNRTKELSKQLLEQIKEKQIAQKERRRQNIKRTEENKKKSEIVQVITNSAKLKRMKKKQLRFIEKRDTTKAANK